MFTLLKAKNENQKYFFTFKSMRWESLGERFIKLNSSLEQRWVHSSFKFYIFARHLHLMYQSFIWELYSFCRNITWNFLLGTYKLFLNYFLISLLISFSPTNLLNAPISLLKHLTISIFQERVLLYQSIIAFF